MKKSRFAVEQILGILREQKPKQRRATSVSGATFCNGRERQVEEALAEAELDRAMLREIAAKKW